MAQRIFNRNRLAGRVRRLLDVQKLRKMLDRDDLELTKIGSAYGGWILPKSRVQPQATAVCAGVGEDISFDVELNKKGLRVIALDPTPRAMNHVLQVMSAAGGGPRASINRSSTDFYDLQGFDPQRFTFWRVGLWNQDATMRFFAPEDRSHVSHSVVNLQHTDEWFEARCLRLQEVCQASNVRDVQVLKLDIEGAEYNVLKDMLDCGILPGVVCIEMDELRHPFDDAYLPRVAGAIQMLKDAGYRFRHITNCNVLFVR